MELQLLFYKGLLGVIGLMLFAAGIVDVRKKQISRVQIILLLLACCAVIPFKKETGIADVAGGLAVGFCAVGVSVATREQIGRGDSIVITALGIALGARKCLLVVFAASFLACIAAIAVLAFRIGGRQTRLPFLPAVFAGYVVCFMI
ncbi:MAG: prepilin peptidase [Lachnospiraceae bacterium]|jgi:leader peptidase (prepilin peptidase)/N-methyltransferase